MGKIVHASINEKGSTHGGQLGDQTSREVYVRDWYSRPWNCMLRHSDPSVARNAASIGKLLAESNLVGYGWDYRDMLFNTLRKYDFNVSRYIQSRELTQCDCSSFVHACYACVVPSLREISPPTTSTIPSQFSSRGFSVYRDAKYLTSDVNLRVGDIIDNTNYHVAIYLGDGTGLDAVTSTFKPRTTAPAANDKYWIQVSYGGYNRCINISNGSVLPNCTGYAWGRFLEILRENPSYSNVDCKLSTSNAGEWYGHTSDGYERGNTPKLGAVMCWSKTGGAGHVCIVEKINSDGSVLTSESGYYSRSRFWTQTRSGSNWGQGSAYQFQGFIYNPAAEGSGTSIGTGGQLYDHLNDRQDAIIREVGFLSPSLKPSIQTSGVKLSLINSTTVLSLLFGGQNTSSSEYDISALSSKQREVVEFLTSKGLNLAGAIGILANIEHESPGINTAAIGDHGTSFGICQWHNERGSAMKSYVGSDWSTNLTGQLNYLWSELTAGYQSVLSQIQSVPDTLEGAKKAADIFVRGFEKPANVDSQSLLRQATAAELWGKCSIILSSGGSGVPTGNVKNTVNVPSYIQQTGIISNYTNYTYWYPKWNSSALQRTIADIWNSQGRPSKNYVATISGYYLVAVAPIFGSVGDVIKVTLSGGLSFGAIIADAKGADATNVYGHVLNGKVDIIEWEMVGSSTYAADTSGQSRLTQGLSSAGFYGKTVVSISNYGRYGGLN